MFASRDETAEAIYRHGVANDDALSILAAARITAGIEAKDVEREIENTALEGHGEHQRLDHGARRIETLQRRERRNLRVDARPVRGHRQSTDRAAGHWCAHRR